VFLAGAVVSYALAQVGRGVVDRGDPTQVTQEEGRLPNGKMQRDEILKAEYEQNVKDAAKLADLAQELKDELEKNDRFVLSLTTLKKTDEIEKLARKIRSRLRRN
jgi:hypothetical protein